MAENGQGENAGLGVRAQMEQRARILKIFLKRAADVMEKMAVGSLLIGLFQHSRTGVGVGVICMIASYILAIMEDRE